MCPETSRDRKGAGWALTFRTAPLRSWLVRKATARSQAFTLIEVVLALVLVVMLTTLSVIALPSLQAGQAFDTGVMRFASAIRMMRVEAATRGRTLRLSFTTTGDSQVAWEPDPLINPGQFQPFDVATWTDLLPNDLVQVTASETSRYSKAQVMAMLLGDSSTMNSVPPQATSGDSGNLAAIDFYPDGTVDSATITLMPRDANDQRQATVTILGTTGQVTTQITSTATENE